MTRTLTVDTPNDSGLETQIEEWSKGTIRLGRPANSISQKGKSLPMKMYETLDAAQARLAMADEKWHEKLCAKEPASGKGMGGIERDLLDDTLALQAAALTKRIQQIAHDTPPNCPVCGAPLKAVQWVERTVYSRFGPVRFSRAWGRCPECDQSFAPADHALDLPKNGKNSPEMSEQIQLLGAVVPPAQAAKFTEKIFGFETDANRIARELERAGEIEKQRREADDEKALDTSGRWEITDRIRGDLPDDLILCIQMDGFMTRERDHWGRSDSMRAAGEKIERWHETKAATIFQIQDRVQIGQSRPRPAILRRTFLATRAPAYEFGRRLYAQAVRQGLLLAKEVYVIADGAVWIWKLVEDRFRNAGGTLDFYHAAHHIETLSGALFRDEAKAKAWSKTQRKRLKAGRHKLFLNTVEDLARVIETSEPRESYVADATVLREWEYFNRHRDHFDYAKKSKRGLPIGSGCIESTCKQYQLRVKRMGQFWKTDNLEGILLLYSKHLSFLWN